MWIFTALLLGWMKITIWSRQNSDTKQKSESVQRSAKRLGTWLREISSCSCLTVLPGTAWLLLNKICTPHKSKLEWKCVRKKEEAHGKLIKHHIYTPLRLQWHRLQWHNIATVTLFWTRKESSHTKKCRIEWRSRLQWHFRPFPMVSL